MTAVTWANYCSGHFVTAFRTKRYFSRIINQMVPYVLRVLWNDVHFTFMIHWYFIIATSQEHDGVSNQQQFDCLLNHLLEPTTKMKFLQYWPFARVIHRWAMSKGRVVRKVLQYDAGSSLKYSGHTRHQQWGSHTSGQHQWISWVN